VTWIAPSGCTSQRTFESGCTAPSAARPPFSAATQWSASTASVTSSGTAGGDAGTSTSNRGRSASYFGMTRNSVRRFLPLPFTVLFDAMGFVGPKPVASSRSGEMPFATR